MNFLLKFSEVEKLREGKNSPKKNQTPEKRKEQKTLTDFGTSSTPVKKNDSNADEEGLVIELNRNSIELQLKLFKNYQN